MKHRPSRNIAVSLAIAVAATVFALTAMQFKALRALESFLYDIRQVAFSPETSASDDIVIVLLDEQTMREVPYRTPIPRDFLARLHKVIVASKPKLIAYDIFFKDPSFTDADKALADAFRRYPPYAVVPRRPDGTVDMPLPLFMDALAGVGLADLPLNPFDATVRTARFEYSVSPEGEMDLPPPALPLTKGEDRFSHPLPFVRGGSGWGSSMKSFAATIFETVMGTSAQAIVEDESRWPRIGPFKLTPELDEGEVYIRFAGPPGRIGDPGNAFKMYSAALVEKGLVPKQWLEDKIVLVGAGYEDLKDMYLTPYHARTTGFAKMNGVEIHANILSGLLTAQFYYIFKPWLICVVVFICALIMSVASVWWSMPRAAVVFFVVTLAVLAKAVAYFHLRGIVLPVTAPLVGSIVAYGSGLGWRALTEGRQKRFIKRTFAKYVPAAVVDRITEDPGLLRLGGEERIVTSLFTDIESFTSISERMRPKELVEFLNSYLSRMNEILFKYGATLDKYEGDAIIAFFNAPLDVARHELAAARAAIGIKRASAKITEEWTSRLGRGVVTRIGLNSGPAIVGNMGSEGRFDYTAIGDTINIASRLEGANKFYGTTILASETTAAVIGDSIVTRPVDCVRVKGKKEALLIHEVMGETGEIDRQAIDNLIVPYREAWRLFQSRDIRAARDIIGSILARIDDSPSRALVAKLDRAEREHEWDLVTELTSK